MMRLFAKVLMLVGCLTISTQILALGLGELTLRSALNQPLDAEIELVDAEGLSQWEIKPFLASNVAFEQAGVDRPYFLTKIRFKVEGQKVRLTTKDPVTEPFLNFLMELNWPSGRVLREYTVLLDPPTFEDDNYQPLASTPSSAGMETTQFQGGSNQGRPSQSRPTPPAYAPTPERAPTEQAPVEQPGTYRVQPNDTLWSIALRTRPSRDITPQQMMVAIQSDNPEAFIGGNINRLKTHSVLRIPDQERVNGITFNAAVSEVARQNREVNAGPAQLDATGRDFSTGRDQREASGGEVKLVSARANEARSAGASGDVTRGSGGRQEALENELAISLENLDKTRRENKELRDRLEDLSEQLDEMQRLLTMKNSQLAHMQANAAQQAGTSALDESPISSIDGSSTQLEAGAPESDATAPVTQPAPAIDAQQQAATAPPAPAPRPEEPIQPRKKFTPPPPPPTFLESLMEDPITLVGGLGALLLLVGLAVMYVRKRKEDDEEEAMAAEDTAIAEPISLEVEDSQLVAAEEAPKDDFDDLNNFNFDTVSDDDGGSLMGGLDLGDELTSADDTYSETVSSESSEVASPEDDSVDVSDLDFGDEDDDLFELVDLDVAYGRFDDAVSRLQSAIDAQPGRTDVRLRLLELLVEMGDSQRYVEQENAVIELGDAELIQQASDLRQLLSDPIEPTAQPAADLDDVASDVDVSIDQIGRDLNDSLEDGISFGDALDISDDDQALEEFSFDESETSELAELADESEVSEDDMLDLATLEAELGEDVAELEKQDEEASEAEGGLEFDLSSLAEQHDEEESSTDVEVDDSNLMEFDAAEIDLDQLDEVAEPDDVSDVDDENSMEFDLSSLEELDEMDVVSEAMEDEEPDNLMDFEEIEVLTETEGEADNVDEETFEEENQVDFDLGELEDELGELEEPEEVALDAEDDQAVDFDLSELDAELGGLEEESSEIADSGDAMAMDSDDIDALDSDLSEVSLEALMDAESAEHGEFDLAELKSEFSADEPLEDGNVPSLDALGDLPELDSLADDESVDGLAALEAELEGTELPAADDLEDIPELEVADGDLETLEALDELPELESLEELPELEAEAGDGEESVDVLASLDEELPELESLETADVAELDELPELESLEDLPELEAEAGDGDESADVLASLDEELPELESLEATDVAEFDELPELDSLDELPELEVESEGNEESADVLASLDEQLPELESLETAGVAELDELPELESLDELPELEVESDGNEDPADVLASLDEELPELESLEAADVAELDDLPELEVESEGNEESADVLASLDEELPELESLEAADVAELDELPELDDLDDLPELEVESDENEDPADVLASLDEELPELESLEAADVAELDELPELDDLEELPELEVESDESVDVLASLDEELPELDSLDELPELGDDDTLPELDETASLDDLPVLDVPDLDEAVDEIPELDALPELEPLEVAGETETASDVEPSVIDSVGDAAPVAGLAAAASAVAASSDSGVKTNDIDLEALARTDDEFDFLSGTDECDTKLELAQEYLNMGDEDGARELLGEVVSEGTDPQIHKARELLDTFA